MLSSHGEARRLTRRELVKAVGLAGLGIAGGGLVSGTSAGAGDSPEVFLAWAYARRSYAAQTGDIAALDQIYDPANRGLVAFERQRARFMHHGGRFQGPIRSYTSTISIVDVQTDPAIVTAKLRERLDVEWTPPPLAPALQAPGRLEVPRGPSGESHSVAVIKHEVELTRGVGGWRIGRDQHDEFDLFGRSPDLQLGSWAVEVYGRSRAASLPLLVPPAGMAVAAGIRGFARPLAAGSYDRLAAFNYARTYATSPYYRYCDYTSCGGDCTNFGSQVLRQGGHPDVGTYPTSTAWATHWPPGTGGCGNCGTSADYAGTDRWADANGMPTWLLGYGDRATSYSSQTQLYSADLINYDWTPANGWYDHLAITSYFLGNGDPEVCSHTPNRLDWNDWTFGDSTAAHKFIHINAAFSA